MNKLFWLFSCCLILVIEQAIGGIAFAMSPTIGTGYASLIKGGCNGIDRQTLPSTGNNDIIQQNEVKNGEINTLDNNGIVKINVSQPILTFTSAPLLGGRCGNGHSEINGTGFITQGNCFNLDSGNILISPEKDLVIGTEEGLVSIGSGATIFVMESSTDMIIYDLYQTKPRQVSVQVSNHTLVMEPGCMLVVTKEKTRNFEDLNADCHSVNYRRVKPINLPEINAFVANFSILSALTRIQPLKELFDSKDKQDQLLLHRLLKSAALLRT